MLPVRSECVSGEHLRGKMALRFPYLYICFVLIAYMLMYSIQLLGGEAQKTGKAGAART